MAFDIVSGNVIPLCTFKEHWVTVALFKKYRRKRYLYSVVIKRRNFQLFPKCACKYGTPVTYYHSTSNRNRNSNRSRNSKFYTPEEQLESQVQGTNLFTTAASSHSDFQKG